MPDYNTYDTYDTANDKPYDLMDGATGDIFDVARQVDQQRKIAADEALPIQKRLESYEDIIDSEVVAEYHLNVYRRWSYSQHTRLLVPGLEENLAEAGEGEEADHLSLGFHSLAVAREWKPKVGRGEEFSARKSDGLRWFVGVCASSR